MGVSNGSTLLEEEKTQTPADKKTMSRLFRIIYRPRCGGEAVVDISKLQQIKPKDLPWLESVKGWFSQYTQLAHYFSLLCFLLTIITLLLTFCLLQITLVFQSQSKLRETKVRDLTNRLEKLNQSYRFLFSQYPALNQYCPVSNSTTGERKCSPCPAGWTSEGEKCFLFSKDRADWISSQYRCMALGGAVVQVRTEEEQVFLWKTAQSLSQGDSYWLGMRSSSADGSWQWSDGSLMEKGPQFWQREPDKTDTRELCGRLTPGDNYRRTWFVSKCSSQLRSICERRQSTLQ
ncbi:C-type lectin domain family 6 member A-like isoform X1 [Thunnus maccoyii]|uniref:C-type lectin domain family 6 member A-like isoform X1 n=1 Tax=Thunnus maccoyii TaxID=8240 RepID=UPI001C4B00CC|nr:C-type lectin domain family 6 member A-like isoform X1 [Thunnus maccoyii]